MGKILANAGPRYRGERPLSAKDGQMPPAVMSLLAESGELWAEYIGLCLHPDYKISSKHALRISNSLKTICQSLLPPATKRRPGRLVRCCSRRWRRPGRRTGSCWSTRCHVRGYLPQEKLPELVRQLAAMPGTGNPELDIIVLHELFAAGARGPRVAGADPEGHAGLPPRSGRDHLAHDWLRARLLGEAQPEPDAQTISRIHLSNLKNAVHWTVKLTQINILTQCAAIRTRRSIPRCIFPTFCASASICPCVRRRATRCLPLRRSCSSTRSTRSSST